MAVVEVICIECGGMKVVKYGKSQTGEQRYLYRAVACKKTFQSTYRYKACEEGVKDRILILDIALNGSGIRDTARVLSKQLGG